MALLPCVCVDCMCYQAAHMSNEEDVNIDVMGQTYILDFTEMQQVRILSVLDALCMEHASSDQ